jgi:hypothetical protein
VRRSVRPLEYSLRADQKGIVPVSLSRSDLLGDAPIGSPAHPSWLRGWRAIRSVVMRLQFPAQAHQSQVGTVNHVPALAGVAEPVAMAAGEELTRSVKPGHLAAAIHAIAADIAGEPRPFAAEAAGCPPYRHRLVNLLPLLALKPVAVVEYDLLPAPAYRDPRCRRPVLVGPVPSAARTSTGKSLPAPLTG